MNSVCLCSPRFIPIERKADADEVAARINPKNRAVGVPLGPTDGGERLVADRRTYWGPDGVRLTVGFLDGPEQALRTRILAHLNAWGARGAHVEFVESNVDPEVRISRLDGEEGGYWSYLGTDILTIDAEQPTMNLEGFTMQTEESEFRRVVRHEAGHTLGFPHEHMRKALVDKLDRERVIAYYRRTQGWSRREVMNQVLTPLEISSLLGSTNADSTSIMCYHVPGRLTTDGVDIPGGLDITDADYEIAGALYPGPT